MPLTPSLAFLIYHIALFGLIYVYYILYVQHPLEDKCQEPASITRITDLATKTSPYYLGFVSAFLANTFAISRVLQQLRDQLIDRYSRN